MKPVDFFYGDRVLVSGHRGEREHGIENTMSAFCRTLKAGVDMLETDVRMTADGELVLMHDIDVDRTTDGIGLVADLTLEEILKMNAMKNSTEGLPPEPPATLDGLLELVKDWPDVLLNIEFKDYPTPGNEQFAFRCADKICERLIQANVQKRVWINSFDGRILEHVYRKYGKVFHYHGFYPWFILGEMSIDPESFIDVACMQHRYIDQDGNVVKYDDPLCPKEWFDYLLSLGIMPLMAPSLKEYPLYDLAFSWGSRIVNTDEPEKMICHLREKGLYA